MIFKNYCLIVIGETKIDVLKNEIEVISELKPNILQNNDLLIGTFSSVFTIDELKDFFGFSEINFMIFELNKDLTCFSFLSDEIQSGLFGFLECDKIKEISNEILFEIKYDKDALNNMNNVDKNKFINDLLDKGVCNLTDYDKKLLSILVK